MDPTYAALRRATALAARQHDHGAWREQSLVLADYLEETGEDQAAQRRRALVTRKRSPGCQWPRVSRIAGLSDHQREVLACTLTRPFAVLCGTPGTGKTYCTAAIIEALGYRHDAHTIAMAAPTGKAAVRITEALARHDLPSRATTIHSLLEIGRNGHDGQGWGFRRNAVTPLEQRFVIIDEASMLDTDLAAALFSACRPGTHVLLVGDPYQLPPVGHGAPLRDLIASSSVPVGHLTEIRRNAGLIVHACAAIKDGRKFETVSQVALETFPERNLLHYEIDKPETQITVLKETLDWIRRTALFDHFLEVQVLAAVNDKSPLSRDILNKTLQREMNGAPPGDAKIPYLPDDKIICLRNHWILSRQGRSEYHYIANGECGRVLTTYSGALDAVFFDPSRHVYDFLPIGPSTLNASPDGRKFHDPTKKAELWVDLGYTITTHKAQGNEWPCVILMIDSSPSARRVCSREWVYTAISRASKLCITIGRMSVLQQMCRRPSLENRKTFLQELLTEHKRIQS